MSIDANPFEELCSLASLDRWCLDPACTTCRNHHLSVGLALIAHGVPLAAWDHTTTRWPTELASWTRWRLGAAKSERLAEVLGNADLVAIEKEYRLGWLPSLREFLALTLRRSGLSESDRDKVNKAWSKWYDQDSQKDEEKRRKRLLENRRLMKNIKEKHPGFLERNIGNGFEKICHLSALNHWRWRINLSNNLHLRVGLLLIARNIPLSTWDYTAEEWPNELIAPTRRVSRGLIPLRKAESDRLAEVLAKANLLEIRKDAVLRWFERSCDEKVAGGREDWLGYLGVALLRFRFSTLHREQVGQSWRAQLNRMAGNHVSDTQPVTFGKLDSVETYKIYRVLETYERLLSQQQIKEIYQV